MRLGYGYKRQFRDFANANVKQTWIDHPGTRRAERDDLLTTAVRAGDTIVLLAPGDLGAGGELPMLRTALRERGVTIEVIETQTEPARPRGRPGRFNPDKDQLERIRRMYVNPLYGGSGLYDEACKIVGWKPTRENKELIRGWLWRHYGPRGVLKNSDEN